MWIEKINNSKGIRYKFCERFLNPKTDKYIKVSVILNNNSRHAQRKAIELLQIRFNEKYINNITKQENKLDNLTFYDVADEWLEYTSPMIKPTTFINHQNYVNRIKKAIAENLLFIDFSPAIAEQIPYKMYYQEKLSFSYANSTLITIKSIIKYAKKANYIKNITDFEEIKLKKRPATEKEFTKSQNKFLDKDELKECIHQLKNINPRIALAMEFIALTGLRCGEMLALRLQDYDATNSKINVNGTIIKSAKNGEDIQRGTPKNVYSYRDVYLNDRAKAILNKIILENKSRTLWDRKNYTDRGYIFTNKKGFPLNIQFINKKLRLLNINNKKISTHIFRHTHISILAELGISLKTIMERVGHNDPNTTLSIYTHVTNTMKSELINKLKAFSLA